MLLSYAAGKRVCLGLSNEKIPQQIEVLLGKHFIEIELTFSP